MPDAPAPQPSTTFLRIALGFIYFQFGILKFFPDLSPAEMIGTQTVMAISSHLFDANTALLWLAVIECGIGILLLFNLFPRITFVLFMLHMAGTFSPLFVLPEFTFVIAPFVPNMEGQYIFKNLVFVAAGWTVLRPQLFPRSSRRLAREQSQVAHASSDSHEPTPAESS